MVGRDVLFWTIDRALECSPGDQTEVVVRASDSYLTRFTNNYIHQNVGERDSSLAVRVIFGKRIGQASTNSLTDQAVRETVAAAARIARLQQPNEEFRSLPGPGPVRSVRAWDDAVAECPAPKRAGAVKAIIDRARAAGVEAAGALSTAAHETAVGNSLGVKAYHPGTVANLSVVMDAGEGRSTGFAGQTSYALAEIDPAAAASEALDRCLSGTGPLQMLGPGSYEVVLQPYAVATMVGVLSRLAFSGRALQEGRSPLCGRIGQRVMSERISIVDDGLDPAGLPVPFDVEGVPKRRLELVAKGVATAVAYDSLTAGREGKESTGHATRGGRGPSPANVFLEPGGESLEQMVGSMRRGLIVTRFHYVNPVHALRTIITGMTRDGTFLVEDGQVKGPVTNLRFTQSILEALSHVEAVGAQRVLVGGMGGAILVPALKLGQFNFTGATEA